MPKKIYVTRAQVRAARLLVDMADRGVGGAKATPAVRAVANAKKAVDAGSGSRSPVRAAD